MSCGIPFGPGLLPDTSTIRALVRPLLQCPDLPWTLQGFGMLRLHLTDGIRLNIWDSRHRVIDVSLMHTHPWNFVSLVVSGTLLNRRYIESLDGKSRLYRRAVIQPGPGGRLLSEMQPVYLIGQRVEIIPEGHTYEQKKDEIHVSDPVDGTVTLNWRQRVGDDTALVFWPDGERWVSAEPKAASRSQVADICTYALDKF